MSGKLLTCVFIASHLIATCLFAQIATKTGSLYGHVEDESHGRLVGVTVSLESNENSAQVATSGTTGAFRFTNLPPGIYSATFRLQTFTEVQQDGIRVTTGSSLELKIVMKPAVAEEVSVIGESPLADTGSLSNDTIYSSEYLDQVPVGHDPWFVLNMTPGVDSARFNTGAESGQQVGFYARGANFYDNVWNYDGVNFTDGFGGSPLSYFDFESFEEIQISTGANDASIQTGGIAINLVTKRAGNKWAADASYYFSGESLQGTNTPQELIDHPINNPVTGLPAQGSDRIDSVHDFGFNAGGPILKDKLFVWGSYRKYFSSVFDLQDILKKTELTDYNAKLNFNSNSANESQLGYFLGLKHVDARPYFTSTEQAPEATWVQDTKPDAGMWSAQHSWIPNDHFLLTARYGYIGGGFSLIPPGGKDVPMIYLEAIPHWENTFYYVNPNEQPNHDVTIDANYFKEDWIGADHEFKFGFEYKNTSFRIFSSYGNGVLVTDHRQTVAGGPLTEGTLTVQHYVDGRSSMHRTSGYLSDTIRKERFTLNLGLRFDHQTGKNESSSVPGVPGFENDVGPFTYEGGDPGITFNNVSPRLGATYDLTGDGKTIFRGNFARYYNAYDPSLLVYSNPTFVYNGAYYNYTNRNGDRVITPDEITSGPDYYGGLNGGVFDLEAFLSTRHSASDLTNGWGNEILVGVEREIITNLSVSAIYTYRKYGNLLTSWPFIPYGISSSDFVPGGIYHADTSLGTFDFPYFVLSFPQDGSALITNFKDLYQTYNGLDIIVQKRMSQNFMINGAFTYQRQIGHYDGGNSTGFVTSDIVAFDPTNQRFLNNKPYVWQGRGLIHPYADWNLKVSGVYQLPWNLSAAAYLRYQQGYPFYIFGTVKDPNLTDFYGSSHIIMVEPIGSRRLDNVFTIDLQFQKIFNIKEGRLGLIVSIFNLTNANTVLARQGSLNSETLNQIEGVLSPRAARLGISYSF